MYGGGVAVESGSSTGTATEADVVGGDAHNNYSGGSLREVEAAKLQVSANCCLVNSGTRFMCLGCSKLLSATSAPVIERSKPVLTAPNILQSAAAAQFMLGNSDRDTLSHSCALSLLVPVQS